MQALLKHRKELNIFLNGLGDKYLPGTLRPTFSTTTHFMERLIQHRSDKLSKLWVSTLFTKLFRNRLCEFLYLVEITPHKGRINIQFEGRTVALVKEIDERVSIRVITCFSGVALNPTLEYNVLSLDGETK